MLINSSNLLSSMRLLELELQQVTDLFNTIIQAYKSKELEVIHGQKSFKAVTLLECTYNEIQDKETFLIWLFAAICGEIPSA